MRKNEIEIEVPVKEPLPELAELHFRRPGLTADICRAYAEAAGVCLSRHHTPPIEMSLTGAFSPCLRQVAWQPPTARAARAWQIVTMRRATERIPYPWQPLKQSTD